MNNITINDILYVVLTAAVPLVLRFLWQYCSAKYADSKNSDAINAVFSAVEYVNQIFVDTLKQEGNFDSNAQVKAFTMAKDAALETMSKSTFRWLEKTYSDVDEWLNIQIEAAVKGAKQNG